MKKINILELRPTQFAIGMLEVDDKVKKYSKLTKQQIQRDALKHPVSIVIAPNGDPYIVDGHHRVMALWLMGFRKVPTEVKKDFRRSVHTFKTFWHEMIVQKWPLLHDQFGDGPRNPIYLPKDIRGVSDDPYRSLAWLLRQEGCFKKSNHWFTDYEWAKYLRKKKVFKDEFDLDFDRAVKVGIKLARQKSAKKLPGYIDPSSSKHH